MLWSFSRKQVCLLEWYNVCMAQSKVQKSKSAVNALCEHPLVKSVTFVGTSAVAELLSHKCTLLNKQVLCLGNFS
jgi:acyl-CoA reductase-like NAD-dependent aldehyde dehydrogenase